MKTLLYVILLAAFSASVSSCGVFSKSKTGCPSNGKNVGAERILSGEKVPKAKKFNS